MDFFQTVLGHHLAETMIRQMPRLVEQLERLNDNLEKMQEIKEDCRKEEGDEV